MRTVSHKATATLITCLAVLAMPIVAAAQAPTRTLMSSLAANTKQLHQYTFKQRTEMYHKGELKNAKIDEIHYSVSGERVSVPLETQASPSDAPRRGPGHRIVAR